MAQSGAALEAPSLPSSAVLASADMDIFNFGVFCGAVEMSPSISGDGSLWLRVEQLYRHRPSHPAHSRRRGAPCEPPVHCAERISSVSSTLYKTFWAAARAPSCWTTLGGGARERGCDS